MAVGVIIDCKGATLDQYDQVLAKMGRTPRGRGARAACSTGSLRPKTGFGLPTCADARGV